MGVGRGDSQPVPRLGSALLEEHGERDETHGVDPDRPDESIVPATDRSLGQLMEPTLWEVTSDDADLSAATATFHRERAYETLGWHSYHSQRPCPKCGSYDGQISDRKGQNVVRCRHCKTHIYNAPKTETGQKPRTIGTIRRGIKPGQQVRILERDGCCVLCGSRERLTIGHGLSIKDAETLGEVGPYLDSDENLFAMCEACNAGLGGRSVLPKTYHLVVLRLIQAARHRDHQSSQQLSVTRPSDAEHTSALNIGL